MVYIRDEALRPFEMIHTMFKKEIRFNKRKVRERMDKWMKIVGMITERHSPRLMGQKGKVHRKENILRELNAHSTTHKQSPHSNGAHRRDGT